MTWRTYAPERGHSERTVASAVCWRRYFVSGTVVYPNPQQLGRHVRNAAEAYGVDPDVRRNALTCDAVKGLREGYATSVGSAGTIRPQASLVAPSPRTRRELFRLLTSAPFGP